MLEEERETEVEADYMSVMIVLVVHPLQGLCIFDSLHNIFIIVINNVCVQVNQKGFDDSCKQDGMTLAKVRHAQVSHIPH